MADLRLAQHIEKGNEDGLLISSVASCSNLWALIMDAGTGFTSQVYQLSPQFLNKVAHLLSRFVFVEFTVYACFHTIVFLLSLKEWIMEQWEKNYYISAVAGANNGSSLVVMSKGKKNYTRILFRHHYSVHFLNL